MHSLAALEYPRKEPGYIAGKSVRETYVVAPDTYVLPKPVRVTVGSSIAEGANFRCWEATTAGDRYLCILGWPAVSS